MKHLRGTTLIAALQKSSHSAPSSRAPCKKEAARQTARPWITEPIPAVPTLFYLAPITTIGKIKTVQRGCSGASTQGFRRCLTPNGSSLRLEMLCMLPVNAVFIYFIIRKCRAAVKRLTKFYTISHNFTQNRIKLACRSCFVLHINAFSRLRYGCVWRRCASSKPARCKAGRNAKTRIKLAVTAIRPLSSETNSLIPATGQTAAQTMPLI